MSDRDESLPAVKELAEIIDDAMDTSVRAHGQIPNWRWDGPLNAADAVLRAGFRGTVTPEQIETAAKANAELDGSRCFSMLHEDEQDDRDAYREGARAAARAFGLVPEDGEQ